MKKFIFIPLWFFYISIFATNYYCSPTGSDSNTGTFASPWWSFRKAAGEVSAGDTVFFRGGIYLETRSTSYMMPQGTAAHPIIFMAYPADYNAGNKPIIDGVNCHQNGKYGVDLRYGTYFKVVKITVRNFIQETGAMAAMGFNIQICTHITFDRCESYNNGGHGFLIDQCDDVNLINCDSHHNCNCAEISYVGGGADGFNIILWESQCLNYTINFTGCRSWANSDDGFDLIDGGHVTYNNCWSFDNGRYDGDGNGFKYGFMSNNPSLARVITNCISAYNEASGFHENNSEAYNRLDCHIYNNTSYHNGGIGFYNYNTTLHQENQNIYRNNLSYANSTQASFLGAYVHDHNSWDASPSVTVTNADFISVDSTGLSGARQTDGSLPDLNFLKLASSSDLIDKGIDVGLDYSGSAPDLGWAEYEVPDEPIDPVVIYTNSVTTGTTTATTGGNVIDDGGGTVSARGVAYGSGANPTIAGSHTHDGTGTGTFVSNISGLTPNTSYHVRAYATNEAGTSYGADVPFTTNSESGLSGNQVFSGGKVVTFKDEGNIIKIVIK